MLDIPLRMTYKALSLYVLLIETFVDPQRLPRDHLPSCQLVIPGTDPRILPHPAGLQRDEAISQEGICSRLAGRCAGIVIPSSAQFPLPYWSPQNHAECRTHVVLARILLRHGRSPSPPRTAAPSRHGAWPSLLPRSCVGCGVTKPLRTGPKA